MSSIPIASFTATSGVEVIQSNKGGRKLCYEGFMYVVKKMNANSIRWQCTHQSSQRCKGGITTNLDCGTPRSIVIHNHPANRNEVEGVKLRSQMKSAAKNSQLRPNQVLAQSLRHAPDNVITHVGRFDSIKRDLQRQQRGFQPRNPASLQDLIIPADWRLTGETPSRPFLIHDSGTTAQQRVVVYAAEEQLRLLSQTTTWYMDGNFSMSPPIFQQLYVIRAPLGDHVVSCVYAFLPSKSQQVYQELLQAVLDKMQNMQLYPDPMIVVTDFELAIIRTVSAVFGPNVRTQGCFYHLRQSTWRKVQELGLVGLYREDEATKRFCGMLDGLAFLPEHRVGEGMQYLKDHVPEGLERLVEYFDSTYVTGTFHHMQPGPGTNGTRLRVRFLRPRFPPHRWNVHDATLNGGDRTNNACEGWNTAFSQLIGHKHPSFWAAVEGIRSDHSLVRAMMAQHTQGQLPRRRKFRKYEELQNRLQKLCSEFVATERTLPDFLVAIGHNIHLP